MGFISCLLIAGTFADYFVDKVGSCVKVRDGGRNNIVLDLEYMNDMSEEQKKKLCEERSCFKNCKERLCHSNSGCYGVEFLLSSNARCTLFMAPINIHVTRWPKAGVKCSYIVRTVETKWKAYSGEFVDAKAYCKKDTSHKIVIRTLGYAQCQEKCVANDRCKGVEYRHSVRICILYYVLPVFGSKNNDATCAIYKRLKYSALNTTHTNKPPTNKPTIKSANLLDQGASGASSVSLNVSTLLVVVFASLFL